MRRLHICPSLVLLIALLAGFAPVLADDGGVLRLELGDADRRGRDVPLVLDALTDAETGGLLTPGELGPRLAEVEILLLGESHTNMDYHRVQLRVLQELVAAGRQVIVGLEMYPYTEQEHLDSWVAGYTTEEGFLELSDWYENWGYHWHYYRDLFFFARENGLPMVALNTPREVVKAVREKGFEGLSEEEAEHVPPSVDLESEEHRRLFKAFFEGDDPIHAQMSEEQWEGMFRAQCTWDATMAHNAVKAFEEHGSSDKEGGEGAILVVLVGSGHVVYGLGIERQARQWFEGEIATLVPIPVVGEGEEKVERVSAAYADVLWGLPEAVAPLYPSLGLSTTEAETGRKVIYVAEESPAEAASFELGDVLIELDGIPIDSKRRLNRHMAAKRWGDAVEAKIERGGETLEITVYLRRSPPSDE